MTKHIAFILGFLSSLLTIALALNLWPERSGHVLKVGDISVSSEVGYIGYLNQQSGTDASLHVDCRYGVPGYQCDGNDCIDVVQHLISEPGVHIRCKALENVITFDPIVRRPRDGFESFPADVLGRIAEAYPDCDIDIWGDVDCSDVSLGWIDFCSGDERMPFYDDGPGLPVATWYGGRSWSRCDDRR